MKPVQFIVPRRNPKETTIAVVNAQFSGADPGLTAFLAHLKAAVSCWVVLTSEGNDEWKDSSEDFNIGDLAMLQGSDAFKTLEPFLADQGIHGLEVHTYSADVGDWNYDTVLCTPELETASPLLYPMKEHGCYVGLEDGYLYIAAMLTDGSFDPGSVSVIEQTPDQEFLLACNTLLGCSLTSDDFTGEGN